MELLPHDGIPHNKERVLDELSPIMNKNKIASVPVTFNSGGKCTTDRTLADYKTQVRPYNLLGVWNSIRSYSWGTHNYHMLSSINIYMKGLINFSQIVLLTTQDRMYHLPNNIYMNLSTTESLYPKEDKYLLTGLRILC